MALSHSTRLQMPAESLQRAVLCLSADWEGVAGGLVADILVGERRLHFHLHTAQSVFLLQTPHLIQPFLSHVFKLVICILYSFILHEDEFLFLFNSLLVFPDIASWRYDVDKLSYPKHPSARLYGF